MQTDHLIAIADFCVYHHIEISFVHLLEQQGLVDIIIIEQSSYIQPEQVSRLEKLVRLHQDLSIHPDDLDVVSDLLDRVESLQNQVKQLQNRLLFYEQLER